MVVEGDRDPWFSLVHRTLMETVKSVDPADILASMVVQRIKGM